MALTDSQFDQFKKLLIERKKLTTPAGPTVPAEIAAKRGISSSAVPVEERASFNKLSKESPFEQEANRVNAGLQKPTSPNTLQGPVMPQEIAKSRGVDQDVTSDLLEDRLRDSEEERVRQQEEFERAVGISQDSEHPLANVPIIGPVGETLAEGVEGVIKSGYGTLGGIAKLGRKGAEFISGSEIEPGKIEQGLLDASEPESNIQSVGKLAGDIAQFFVPATQVAKAEKFLKGSRLAKSVPKMFGDLASGVIAQGTAAAAITSAQMGEVGDEAKLSAALASMFPVGAAASKTKAFQKLTTPLKGFLTEKIPSRLINRMIKPSSKAFNFGKNPGLAVARENIKAKSIKDLFQKISQKRGVIGSQIDDLLKNAPKGKNTIDISPAIGSIDDAIKEAVTRGEKTLVDRLKGIRDGLTKSFDLVDDKLVQTGSKRKVLTLKEAHKLKRQIGEASKWTGQAFDADANQARVKAYRIINDLIEQQAPGVKKLQERYANLLSAQKAAENAVTRAEKAAMIGFGDISAGGTGFLAGNLVGGNGAKTALVGILLKKILSNPRITTAISGSLASPVAPGAVSGLRRGIEATGRFSSSIPAQVSSRRRATQGSQQ